MTPAVPRRLRAFGLLLAIAVLPLTLLVAAPARGVTATPTAMPIGRFNTLTYTKGSLTVVGWTFDPDTPTATVSAHVWINGSTQGMGPANLAHADLAWVYPQAGTLHGYSVTLKTTLAPGNYSICVWGMNTAAGPNADLGCKPLTVLPATSPASMNLTLNQTAATAIRAQAIASHATTAAAFPAGATPAVTLAIATRALLEQALGTRAAPPAVTGVPAYQKVTWKTVVDEQAVMGKAPNLGTYPAQKTGGRTGATYSIASFPGTPYPDSGWPGVGIVGAAPVLPANGKTVQPVIPAFPSGYTPMRAEVAVSAALAQLGTPYVYDAAGPSTFDCSGLTQWAYAKAGLNLYHYTVTQATEGVRVRANQLLPGDLILFGSDLHHVGMYLGAGYMINAPDTGAYVRVDSIASFGDFSLAVRP